MHCPFCDHPTTHGHGKTSQGSQRYCCPVCQQTFTDTFDTLYDRRQVTPEQTRRCLQAHSEGSSLRGVSRTSGLDYGTVVSVGRAASVKGQMVHHQAVQGVETDAMSAAAMLVVCEKKQNQCQPEASQVGDCWVGLSLAHTSGLILAARVGKYMDAFLLA